ncbi:MAG: cytochrome c oxidase subunit 3 family protein [Verrucomicrobia bacterium]|nr:cytochrome c oxidase subunit 3 family protein [Verrucomicrobiota bacterium]
MSSSPTTPILAHQFEDATQQRDAATIGMWLFIATEILFFGGMFLGYTVYRYTYPQAFAEGSQHTLIWFGGTNAAVLLISSTTMALAVHAASENRRALLVSLLLGTASLGALFLVIKGFEYAHEVKENLLPGSSFHIVAAEPLKAEMFFYIYWLMTGFHALHVAIGVVLILIFAARACFTNAFVNHDTPVDLLGLYWHFVDIVWVFLFPLLYLVDRHS